MKPLLTLFIIIGIVLLGIYFWFTTETEEIKHTPLPKTQEHLYDESQMKNLDK
jgi:hypothetical protein